jgi:nanoRNase/pAp phosphatase (c-di-AMP/oligoRNAs hydrolase)
MTQSGAMLAWKYFHPEKQVPTFIKYINDRDLFTNKLPYINEIDAYICSHDRSISSFNNHLNDFETRFDDIVREAIPLMRYYNSLIQRMITSARLATISDAKCLLVNAPVMFATDISAYLLKENHDIDAVCVYNDTKDGYRCYSLRSLIYDVASLANKYGGGGHHNAAGFTIKKKHPLFI